MNKPPHRRKLASVGYDRGRRTVSVRFADGDLATVTLDALEVPSESVERVELDEFRRGVEITLADGTMHDVAADFFTWLTRPDYAAAYPADDALAGRIGRTVVALRKARRVTQAALAAASGMLASNLSRLESGKHVPTLDVLLRIAGALEISLDQILAPPPKRAIGKRSPAPAAQPRGGGPGAVTRGGSWKLGDWSTRSGTARDQPNRDRPDRGGRPPSRTGPRPRR